MGRVWKRLLEIASHHAERNTLLTEPQAREIALAVAREEGVGHPGDPILDYWAYSLARRTRRSALSSD